MEYFTLVIIITILGGLALFIYPHIKQEKNKLKDFLIITAINLFLLIGGAIEKGNNMKFMLLCVVVLYALIIWKWCIGLEDYD